MSGSGDLSEALQRASNAVAEEPAPLPVNRRSKDAFIVSLATAWGEDPAVVLQEFNANTALARLARKLLGVHFGEAFTSDERVYLLREREGLSKQLRGEELDRVVADILNAERDAAGRRRRTISAASIRPTARRGEKAFRSRGWSKLASLFVHPDA